MFTFFQNLSKESRRLFHIRGNVSSDSQVGWTPVFSWEVHSGLSLRFAFEFVREDLREISFAFGLVGITFYFTLKCTFPEWIYPKYRKTFRIYAHEWALWLCISKWKAKDFFDMENTYSFHFLDFFFGEVKHSKNPLFEEDISITFPEKTYSVKAVRSQVTLKRPRGTTKKFIVYDLDCKEGIPFPGKGENSWDCGDDASYGLYTPAKNVKEAVDVWIKSIRRKREVYGGGDNMYCKKGKKDG